jgi:hypothetical protein
VLDDIVRTAWAWREAHPHGYSNIPISAAA